MSRKKQEAQIVIPAGDNSFWGIVICAVRYSLGRRTYMPGLVTVWIMGHCAGLMNKSDIAVMLRDIQYQREHGSLGDACDVATWENFERWLNQQLELKQGETQ